MTLPPATPPNNAPLYVVATIAVVSIIAVTVLLILQPDNTNIAVLLGFGGLMVTNILTSMSAAKKVEEIHSAVNSKMSELLTLTAAAAKAEGVRQEKESKE